MKILLLSANRERTPSPVFPIGLSYLAGPLKAAGHNLKVLDLCFAEDPQQETRSTMADFSPDAVVISLRNIDNVTYPGSRSYIAGVRDVISICREQAVVIVGGSGFSLMPEETLKYLGADYGVVGEGEEILPRLLAGLSADNIPPNLPGVVYKGLARFKPPVPVQAINTPNRSLFDVGRYHREGGMANIQTKRGCPFSCIYCIYPLLEGQTMRLRPIADIIAEIRGLVDDHGVSYLYFVDDIFNYPQDFAMDLCRAMVEHRLPVKWSAFINPHFVSKPLLEAMLAAGCDGVEYGTDSGSAKMLKNLGKSFTVENIREASKLCREANVDFAHYLLFGGPGENRETILESVALMDEIDPTAVIAMTGIRIFPGTAIYRQAIIDGIISPETPILEPTFYISPEISETLCDIVKAEAEARTNWVVPGQEISINDTMLEALRRFAITGPLWKLMKRFNSRRTLPVPPKLADKL